MEQPKMWTQLIAAFAASISALCGGFHVGWPAPSLPKLLAADSDILITSDQSSWIIGFFSFGGMFGPFVAVLLVDRFGRKLSLLMSVIPFLGSCSFIAFARGYWWFLAGRFVGGFASGWMMTVAPMYLGEIADDKIRGALATLLNVMINVGILLPYCIGPWVSRTALAGFGGAMPLVFGLMFVWMPESPYFLVMKGKLDRAEKSLLWLRRTRSVSAELKKVQESVEFDLKNAGTVKELVTLPGNRKALIIISGLAIAQQFSGIGAILAYSGLIFQASGSTLDTEISVIIVGSVQLLSILLTTFTIDFAGRRPLLLLSVSGVILFLGGEALYFQLQAIGTDVSGISWLPVTSMVGYIIFYANGLGCIPHVVLSEIFPCNVKALAVSVYTVTVSLMSIACTKIYQVVADAFGIHFSLWLFVAVTILSLIFIHFILPETKQRSFLSIQEEFRKSNDPMVK